MCIHLKSVSHLQLLLLATPPSTVVISTYPSIQPSILPPIYPPPVCPSICPSSPHRSPLPPASTTVFLRPSSGYSFPQISAGFYLIGWASGSPASRPLPTLLLYFLCDPCSGTLYTHTHVQTYTCAHTLSP